MAVNVSGSDTLIGHRNHISIVATDVPLLVLIATLKGLQIILVLA